MAKLTKAQARLHQDACNLLARPLSSPLTPTEKEFILTHWDPSANHINTVAGAFFTPLELAWDLANEAATNGSLIDLCAGIGTLAYCARNHGWSRDRAHGPTVCVEINPAYIEVGRRILPEAEWIHADVFALIFLSDTGWKPTSSAPPFNCLFDVAISNPPFGFPQHKRAGGYPLKGCPLDLQVLAVAQKVARSATFILSSVACPFEYSGRQGYSPRSSNHFDKFSQQTGIQSDSLCCASVDCAIYRDKWRGVMPNIELVTVDFTINDPDEGEGEEIMQEQEQGHGQALLSELEQAPNAGEGAENNPTEDASGADAPTGVSSSLLSLADIERLLPEISYVTLTRYAQQYADELPSEGAGRKKRYYPEAVEVFKRKRAESTKGRKPASAQGQQQVQAPVVEREQTTPPPSPAPHAPRRPGRPAGAGKKSAQKKAAGKRTQARGRMGARAGISSTVPVPVPASSASTLAMDRAVRELEIAQHVTRLEALKWGIAHVLVEIERLEKLIAQAQGKVE